MEYFKVAKLIVLSIIGIYLLVVIIKYRGTNAVGVNIISGFIIFVILIGIITDVYNTYIVSINPKLTYAAVIGKYESDDGDGFIIKYNGIENKFESKNKYLIGNKIFVQYSSKKPEHFLVLAEEREAPFSFTELMKKKQKKYINISIIAVMLLASLFVVNWNKKLKHKTKFAVKETQNNENENPVNSEITEYDAIYDVMESAENLAWTYVNEDIDSGKRILQEFINTLPKDEQEKVNKLISEYSKSITDS